MANVSNSPQANEYGIVPNCAGFVFDDCISIYILPAWLHRAFTAKFNLMEIHEFSKLRRIASLEDIAHLEILRSKLFEQAMNSAGKKNYYALSSFLCSDYNPSSVDAVANEKDRQEIKNTVNFMVSDKRVNDEALSRLTAAKKSEGSYAIASENSLSNQDNKNEELPYRVVLLNNTLYITVEEGFLTHIEEKANRKAFLTQVLKAAYAVKPISVVNNSVFYRQYLNTLV